MSINTKIILLNVFIIVVGICATVMMIIVKEHYYLSSYKDLIIFAIQIFLTAGLVYKTSKYLKERKEKAKFFGTITIITSIVIILMEEYNCLSECKTMINAFGKVILITGIIITIIEYIRERKARKY